MDRRKRDLPVQCSQHDNVCRQRHDGEARGHSKTCQRYTTYCGDEIVANGGQLRKLLTPRASSGDCGKTRMLPVADT
jgi:hypothetical protein